MDQTVIRLIVHNSHQTSICKTLELNRSGLSIEGLIKISSKELSMKSGKLLYQDNGDELTSVDILSNGDDLYLSDGQIMDSASAEVLHVCMLGAGAVGKSALTLQFIQGQFVPDYDPTIEDAYRKHIAVDGNSLLLDVLDTAGQEDFIALRTSWMRNKDGFVLAFSIIERKSFEDLQSFYEQLCEVYEDDIPPFVLVGNKADLDTPEAHQLHNGAYKRAVTYGEAQNLARKWKAARYIETSAKTGYHVQDMFGGLVREIIAGQHDFRVDSSSKQKWYDKCQIL
mmetsp:Transcript_43810/g.72376  ORF Transcript_43810/g.72376 Transcript_43810/m.72376 type:complete len:283 (+) Transcript_43810:130-978(+)